jgi:hypothetical protein
LVSPWPLQSAFELDAGARQGAGARGIGQPELETSMELYGRIVPGLTPNTSLI